VTGIADYTRWEIKYRIPVFSALGLQNKIAALLAPDPNNRGPDGYLVRSLYFDNLQDGDYWDKINGLEDHKKIRLRIYSPGSAAARLELKEKTGQRQRKRGLTLSREDAERVIAGDFRPLERSGDPLGEKLYILMSGNAYRPKCIVQYRRSAFIGGTNNIRITFDRRIEATGARNDLFSDTLSFYPVNRSPGVTLEVKYDHFILNYIKKLLESADRVPVSYSKYAMGRLISQK
jgi:hypothetical protein